MRITIEIDEEDVQLAALRSRIPLSRHAIARAALRAGLRILAIDPARAAELLGRNRVQVSALAPMVVTPAPVTTG